MFPGQVREDECLKDWTTFHCRSTAQAVVSPLNTDELTLLLKWLQENGKEWRVIGRGSNVLVRDGGYPGVLVDLSKGFSRIELVSEENNRVIVRVESGVGNGELLQWTRQRACSGFGFSFGIPGSVGGGIRMNAGTPLGWFAQILTQVEGVKPSGEKVRFQVCEKDFAYRDFPKGRELVITAAQFCFTKSDVQIVEAEIQAAKDLRKNQPLELPNIGSVFKNPKDDFAARLIDQAGLKGHRIGDAEISAKHANFIVNHGKATTSDVLRLMVIAQESVRKKFGVNLESEVHVIGAEG